MPIVYNINSYPHHISQIKSASEEQPVRCKSGCKKKKKTSLGQIRVKYHPLLLSLGFKINKV